MGEAVPTAEMTAGSGGSSGSSWADAYPSQRSEGSGVIKNGERQKHGGGLVRGCDVGSVCRWGGVVVLCGRTGGGVSYIQLGRHMNVGSRGGFLEVGWGFFRGKEFFRRTGPRGERRRFPRLSTHLARWEFSKLSATERNCSIGLQLALTVFMSGMSGRRPGAG